mgnify:CR=1 FL=1
MRAFKQFYIEFDAEFGVWNKLPVLAAVAVNILGRELRSIDFRKKAAAEEYKVVTSDDVEIKVDCSHDPKVWIHLSAPEDSEVNLKELAYEIINHPEFLKVNKEKGEENES